MNKILIFFQKYNWQIHAFLALFWLTLILLNYSQGIEIVSKRNAVPGLFLLFAILAAIGGFLNKRRNYNN